MDFLRPFLDQHGPNRHKRIRIHRYDIKLGANNITWQQLISTTFSEVNVMNALVKLCQVTDLLLFQGFPQGIKLIDPHWGFLNSKQYPKILWAFFHLGSSWPAKRVSETAPAWVEESSCRLSTFRIINVWEKSDNIDKRFFPNKKMGFLITGLNGN